MKNKIKNTVIILLISLGYVSCSDFLVEEPPTFIAAENFYKTEEDARNAVDGVYERMANVFGRRWMSIDLYTDDIVSKRGNTWTTPMANHTVTPSFELFDDNHDIYFDWWIGIGRANDVIKNASAMDLNQDFVNLIIGEARALRGFYYYNLVRAFGDMPLIIEGSDWEVARTDVDDIYNQIIIPDLLFAAEHCSIGLHDGHITKWTAKVILAEVYLTRAGKRRTSQGVFVQGDASNYALARDMAKDVIDNSPHSLNLVASQTAPAYGVAWDSNNTFSKESMLEISYLPIDGIGNWMTREGRGANNGVNYWGRANDVPELFDKNGNDIGNTATVDELSFPRTNNAGIYLPTPHLYDAFEDGDERRDFNIMTRYDVPNGPTYLTQPMFRKFVDTDVLTLVEGSDFRYADNNTILFRFADALLIYAEAQNEADGAPNNDAYKAVNDIRNRAGLDDLTPNLSQSDFRTAIWKERRLEFAGEYKRKFDLIRTDRLTNCTFPINIIWEAEQGSVRSLNAVSADFSGNIQWPDNEWLWPIPQAQLEINLKYGWIQNKGYE
ncbi:putative outer membrane starch-binding protein [Mariniflexile fucanivorans]|uniref:Putative outer membrane starch-binding protein n=1 Tax=Mariniflexile fucanivorans TaxID=264023 RepID=A0A4V2QEC0_9FLAO|nr:RagB/SusD family nutrient uptake outer membrane protein [Mariniflexile fucanivorans]TCL67467.1 putative outer membrane starch-binding protein [Mariniflexile fucanivorans]